MEPLTGRAAVDSIRLWMQIGNSGSRFDGARVSSAIRHRAGRASVLASLRSRLRAPLRAPESRSPLRASRAPHSRRPSRQTGRGHVQTALARPARPRLAAEAS